MKFINLSGMKINVDHITLYDKHGYHETRVKVMGNDVFVKETVKEIDEIINSLSEVESKGKSFFAEEDGLSGADYAEEISSELENYNYHSVTGIPYAVYVVIENVIEDKEKVKEIMKQLYEKRTFFER